MSVVTIVAVGTNIGLPGDVRSIPELNSCIVIGSAATMRVVAVAPDLQVAEALMLEIEAEVRRLLTSPFEITNEAAPGSRTARLIVPVRDVRARTCRPASGEVRADGAYLNNFEFFALSTLPALGLVGLSFKRVAGSSLNEPEPPEFRRERNALSLSNVAGSSLSLFAFEADMAASC